MIFYVAQGNDKQNQLVNQFFTVQADAVACGRRLVDAGYSEVSVVKVEPHGKAQLVELLNVASGHLTMHADAEKVWPKGRTSKSKSEVEDLLS